MKRDTIMIGNDRYVVEMSDLRSEVFTKKFRVLRNYDIINDNLIDSDLYFIDKDINPEEVIWPESDLSVIPIMSGNSSSFNNSFTSKAIVSNAISHGKLIDDELYEKNMKTLTLRIWHPTTSILRDMIVYCDSWINSVHYHWICTKMSSAKKNVGKEIRLNQDIYNEYVEIEIPDPTDVLLSSTYIESNSLIIDNEYSRGNIRYVTKVSNTRSLHTNDEIPIYEDCNKNDSSKTIYQLVDLNMLTRPWKYASDGYSKEYVGNSMVTLGGIDINVTLYPWEKIDDNKTYIIDQSYRPASCRFTNSMKFSIVSSIEFSDSSIGIAGRFDYPKLFDCVSTAWQRIYSTDFSTYKELADKVKDDEEAMEILGNSSSMVKYSCIISSDVNRKYVIHTEVAYSDKVDDFFFPLKNLFDNWNQVPNAVYVTLMVEDRAIGRNASSPTMMITKEKLKYTINDLSYNRISIRDKQIDLTETMNKDNFNFISSINCRIISTHDKSDSVTKNQTIAPRIIYKPVFFRTQDLQNITLRSNLKQNIGISLSAYVNKVNEFVMKIGDINIYESGRNGSFVLFNIDAKEIEDQEGKYDLLSADDNEYISSGKYIIN